MKTLRTLTAFSLRLSFRSRQEVLGPLLVYLIIGSLFPLALGPERESLRTIAPAVIWIAAFLSATLSLPRIFEEDYRDGTLEQLLLLPSLPHFTVMARMAAHWLATGAPLAIASPLLSLMYGLSWSDAGVLLLTLAAGTAILSAILTLAAALTVGQGRGSVTGTLLVLPLCLPVLIYGAGTARLAMQGHMQGQFFSGVLGLVTLALITLPLVVWLGVIALKLAAAER